VEDSAEQKDHMTPHPKEAGGRRGLYLKRKGPQKADPVTTRTKTARAS